MADKKSTVQDLVERYDISLLTAYEVVSLDSLPPEEDNEDAPSKEEADDEDPSEEKGGKRKRGAPSGAQAKAKKSKTEGEPLVISIDAHREIIVQTDPGYHSQEDGGLRHLLGLTLAARTMFLW